MTLMLDASHMRSNPVSITSMVPEDLVKRVAALQDVIKLVKQGIKNRTRPTKRLVKGQKPWMITLVIS